MILYHTEYYNNIIKPLINIEHVTSKNTTMSSS